MNNIDDKTLRKAQIIMLDTLVEVDKICKKHHIQYWLDFDGVILDSMPIRDYGFAKIFEDFDNIIQTLNNDEKIVLETFFQNDSNMDKNKFKNILFDIKKMQKVTSEKTIQSLISKRILEDNSLYVILTSLGLELVDKLFRGKI